MPRGERRPRGVDVPLTRGSLGVRQAVLGKHHEDTLVVSHCWEEPSEPDKAGVQFAAVRDHLAAHPSVR